MNAVLDPNCDASPSKLVTGLQIRFSRQLRVQVADWQDTCRELAAWEDANLVNACVPSALAEHATMLDRLEKFGEWLKTALHAVGSEAEAMSEDVGFTMQDLRDARSLWHGSIAPSRRAEILRECFTENS